MIRSSAPHIEGGLVRLSPSEVMTYYLPFILLLNYFLNFLY